MFLTLLPATLAVALLTSAIIAKLFNRSVEAILSRIIRDDIAKGWKRYILFAIFVVGVSSGVNLWKLEQYAKGYQQSQPHPKGEEIEWVQPELNGETWTLEIYRTVIGTIQGVAWALLIFFLVSLIAFVIVRGQEMKAKNNNSNIGVS